MVTNICRPCNMDRNKGRPLNIEREKGDPFSIERKRERDPFSINIKTTTIFRGREGDLAVWR